MRERIREVLFEFLARGYRHPEEIDTYLDTLPTCRLEGYGGDTMCVEVATARQRVIIDGGSGLRPLGYELTGGECGCGKGELHLLLTHFHWDHLIGLPFFVPLFVPGNTVHVYAVQPELPQVFATLFQPPFFPLSLDRVAAKIVYHRLTPRTPFAIGDLTITPYRLDHPDPCWGFRFEADGKAYAHCVDSEITRVSRHDLGSDLPLYQNVDLMAADAQYTLLESMEKVNWGHGSAPVGLEIAMREGIKRVMFVHHDPAASDSKVAAAEDETRRLYEKYCQMSHHPPTTLHPVEWWFANDGTCVEV